jgi:hypothetical protein
MKEIFVTLVVILAVGLLGIHPIDDNDRNGVRRSLAPASLFAVVAIGATIVLTYAVHVAVLTYGAHTQRPLPGWLAALPLVPLEDRAPYYSQIPLGKSIGAVVVVETFLLIALYLVLRERYLTAKHWVVVAVGASTLGTISLLTASLTSIDIYAYTASAILGISAYHPPNFHFHGEFFAFNRLYGATMLPSPYGPLWLGLSVAVTSPFASLAGKLVALRVLGLTALMCCFFACRSHGVKGPELVLFALNPAFYQFFVQDAHNDITAAALALTSMALARRSTVAAVIAGASAGAIKLTLLSVGAIAFARTPGRTRRVALWVATIVFGVGLCLSVGPMVYLGALHLTSVLYQDILDDPVENVLHASLALAAIGAMLGVSIWKRATPTAAFAFMALSEAFFGWYAIWGLPYAVLERRGLHLFLIAMPILSFLDSTTFARSTAQVAIFLGFSVAIVTYAFVLARRIRRESA